MKIKLLSNRPSDGLNHLKDFLNNEYDDIDAKRLRTNTTYRFRQNDVAISWGNYTPQPALISNYTPSVWLNKDVSKVVDKKTTFESLTSHSILKKVLPTFTTDIEVARSWFNDDDVKVYCRTLTQSSGGDGIVVSRTPEELVNAPLYTLGLDIKHEYRLHVVGTRALLQRKARRDTSEEHADIRNLENGYYFINEFTLNDTLGNLIALLGGKIIEEVGIDFGAIDIVTTTDGKVKLLEINSAPGLSAGITTSFYGNSIVELINSKLS